MAFRAGQKVVCVDASATTSWGEHDLTEGGIYTIRWVGESKFHGSSYLGVRLDEIVRPKLPGDEQDDLPFRHNRFRPVVERKTDISIFTAMLTDTRQPVSQGEVSNG